LKLVLAASAALSLAAPAQAQDAAAGERVFAVCRACHQVGENAKNLVGPTLNGLFGRKAGTVPGFNYSEANRDSGIVWDDATFAAYIRDPRGRIPGTKMVFAGLKSDKQVADVAAYLHRFGPDGKLLP
jgi:cytochrome c